MKNILIFSTAFYPYVGGAEVSVKEITDRIDDCSFDLITAKMEKTASEEELIGKIVVHRVGFGFKQLDKFLLPMLGLFKAIHLNKEKKYSTIWSMMASQGGVAAGLFKLFNKDIKLVLTLEEGDEEEHLKRYVMGNDFLYKILVRPWHLLPFRQADLITTISNYLAKRAESHKVKADIKVIPIGVDIERFANIPSEFERNKLKAKLNILPDEKILVTTSRLVKKNAVGDLISGFSIFVKNNPSYKLKLLIMGGGEKKEELKNLVNKMNIEKKVVFFGTYSSEDLPPYLWSSTVFCRPSLSEGLGISFLEAMTAGVITIATPVGGIPDFLKEGETGFFCEPNDPQSIAKTLTKILLNKHENELQKIRDAALRVVKKSYDWEDVAYKMKDVF